MGKRLGTPKLKAGDYLTVEQEMFVLSRTMPFLDRHGTTLPLTRLLGEAYVQGMRDAIQVFEQRDAPTPDPIQYRGEM